MKGILRTTIQPMTLALDLLVIDIVMRRPPSISRNVVHATQILLLYYGPMSHLVGFHVPGRRPVIRTISTVHRRCCVRRWMSAGRITVPIHLNRKRHIPSNPRKTFVKLCAYKWRHDAPKLRRQRLLAYLGR